MTRCMARVALGTLLAIVVSGAARAQAPEEFQKRRQAVRDAMEPASVLILRAATVVGEEKFRQESNLYYLTGITEPGVSLILYSGPRQAPGASPAGLPPQGGGRGMGGGRTEVLFVPAAESSSGRGAAPAPPAPPPARPGFASVRLASDFPQAFDTALLTTTGTVYVDYARSRALGAPLTVDEQLLKAARDRGASFATRTASSLFGALRRIKSPAEIAALKLAAEITAAAEREAMRAAKPGMYEYQIQSVIEHVFTVNGAVRPGFATIVGSGPDSCNLHWSENTRKTEPGDIVVMDIGAERDMYTGDITRTIPLGGTFSKRQREVYEVVLKANEEAIKMVGPGVSMTDINTKVNDILAEGLIRLGLIKDKSGLRRYYTHGLSHSIGLDVHDLGGSLTVGTLEPGMVITIEPGLYIPEEKLGVRIEDDVLVTPTGYECITTAAPKAVADVEKLMREPGIDFTRYLVKKSGQRP